MLSIDKQKSGRNRLGRQGLAIVFAIVALMAVPFGLPGTPGVTEASCFTNAPLCDIISQYSIHDNGDGSYDITFSFRYSTTGACGDSIADFWSIDCGTGYDAAFNVIHVEPCYSSTLFTVNLKVKGYGASGESLKTGASPSPYTFSKTEISNFGGTEIFACP